MQKPFFLLIIGLFFGTGFGFILAASSGAEFEGHDHGDPAQHAEGQAHDGMDHSAMDHAAMHSKLTEAKAPLPGLDLTLHPDGASSRNLEISLENFAFSPENVNGENTPGAGHAHIYVDGVKLARSYGPWFHISGLSAGEHEIRVTLNANDHSQFAIDGEPVEAKATVVIE
ncbi:hypothetical protein [Roseovarius sp. EL26]|uniref:hypothetical protein n=1 Tax=Roseovarius sp. EL26 TaxID=2126672 RepID=UPI000EA3C8B4|nr:hypothetical protein [Roseovarius sp. EL26]